MAESASSLLEGLRTKRADVKIQIAELSTQFGPSYPKVAQLTGQLREIDAQISGETKKVGGKIHGHVIGRFAAGNHAARCS